MTESEYFLSQEFKDNTRKIIERDTWEQGLPMIYTDDKGILIKHYKDGTITIIKENNKI